MTGNPYTLIFGREPKQLISRLVPEQEVIEAFTEDTPSQQVYIITGVRGAGKTVFMTDIAGKLRQNPDWITVELNTERNLLHSLAAKLSSENSLAKIFQNAKINLSFFGFGLEVSGAAQITDIELALTKMLSSLKKKGKRVLVTIDEVSSTDNMREFASAYQIFIRQDLPLFLLMTGLYENIEELQNEKNLTFLYRTPKIKMTPLNIGTIAKNYKANLEVSEQDALEMARITRGYSFAFQVLGYLTWENGGNYRDILDNFRQYLEEFVYEKIWSEMSGNDRKVAYGIAVSEHGKVSEVREILHITTNQFNPYRKRLIRKGIVDGSERGYVRFILPMFEQFVKENYIEE